MTEMSRWKDCTIHEKVLRWQQAARVLRELPPHSKRKHFDMKEIAIETRCGTVACAAGHCAMDPWFIERGFELLWPNPNPTSRVVGNTAGTTGMGSFFGSHGSDKIFYNTHRRPVWKVIREIEAHIAALWRADEAVKILA